MGQLVAQSVTTRNHAHMHWIDGIRYRISALLWRLGTQPPIVPKDVEVYRTYDEALAAAARHTMSGESVSATASEQPDGSWHLKVNRR